MDGSHVTHTGQKNIAWVLRHVKLTTGTVGNLPSAFSRIYVTFLELHILIWFICGYLMVTSLIRSLESRLSIRMLQVISIKLNFHHWHYLLGACKKMPSVKANECMVAPSWCASREWDCCFGYWPIMHDYTYVEGGYADAPNLSKGEPCKDGQATVNVSSVREN